MRNPYISAALLRVCAILLLAAPVAALGQTACPQGVAPGSPQCGPGEGNGMWTAPPPELPRMSRAKMRGAIAIGPSEYGKAIGAGQYPDSRRDARAAAVAACAANGGQDCQPVVTYVEECASIAYRAADPLAAHAARGQDHASAERAARAQCEQAGGPCMIAYTHCTEWDI